MSRTINKQTDERIGVHRGGIVAIALGILALLACELPVILTLIGLGGLSTAAMALRPHLIVELAAIAVAVIGAVLLFIPAFHRLWSRRKRGQS